MFRVSHRGEGIDDADSIEGARGIVQGQPAGRYDVDEIRAEPFPSGLIRGTPQAGRQPGCHASANFA